MTVQYPAIGDLLQELHATHPTLNFPSFENTLQTYGYSYVNMLPDATPEFLRDIIGIPASAVPMLLERARQVIRCSDKQKA